MQVDRWIRVRCVNKTCKKPADTQVPVEVIAPGVIATPSTLRCQSCGHDVWIDNDHHVKEASADA